MKKVLLSIAIVTLSSILFAASTQVGTGREARAYTVGDLALRLAVELGLEMETPVPEQARQALAAEGIEVAGELGRLLVEDDVVGILNQMNLHLSTSKPDRPVDEAKVELLLGLLGGPGTEIKGGISASDRGLNPPGGGFGRSKSKASPN